MTEQKQPEPAQVGQSQGPAIDRKGAPVADPTHSVRELVLAEAKRQDDLRENDNKWRDKLDTMREQHADALRKSEAERINAIRAVDVAANQQATKDAETRATALAKQVTDTSEAARLSLRGELAPIQEALAQLTQRMYEQQGQKTQVIEGRAAESDFAPMVAAIEKLTAAQNQGVGATGQRIETRAAISSGQALVGTALALLAAAGLYLSARGPDATTPTTPSVVCTATYHPAPCP